jgi:hypothetical protein
MNGLAEGDHVRIADDVAQRLHVGVSRTFVYRRDRMHVIMSPLTEALHWRVLTISRDRESKQE